MNELNATLGDVTFVRLDNNSCKIKLLQNEWPEYIAVCDDFLKAGALMPAVQSDGNLVIFEVINAKATYEYMHRTAWHDLGSSVSVYHKVEGQVWPVQ